MAGALCVSYEQQRYQDHRFVSPILSLDMRKYTSGFNLALETTGDSEGLRREKKNVRSSLVVPIPSPRQDYWCVLKSKDLNMHDVSVMSTTERMQLCRRLKSELEQVRCVFGKIESKSMNAGKTKDMGRKRKDDTPHSRAVKRRKDETPHSRPRADPILMNQCGTILRRLMLHKYGFVFNKPVDVVALNIPDYFTVIKKPMDLGTIKRKLETNSYLDPRAFAADVRLTFANAIKYNPPDNDVHIMAGLLSEIFENKWRSITLKLPEVAEPASASHETHIISTNQYQQKQKQKQKQPFPSVKVTIKSKLKKKAKTDPIVVEPIPLVKRQMTREEKQKLSRDLESLCDMPQQIMELLRENSSHLCQNEDEIEVDVAALNNDTLLQLQKLVSNCVQSNHLKAKPREAEPVIMLRPGHSNCSPVGNIKGLSGKPGDEDDFDIGENDEPVPCYPPVDIEKDKDTVGRSSKGTSYSCDSGSSSSDSGSSCNDSDAAPKAPSPDAASPKGPKGCDAAACNQTSIPSMDSHGAKRAVCGLDEENAHAKPAPADGHGHHEGESAPISSERQVSPDKLYRAALLRSRFADTILKAQEKTRSQGDSGDPEKLRREREELDRKQREEKARLQAEAKAAEMARMQAEAMAAAEAKRKLEIERGAARLALQQMEKTVEIDENTQVLKDLEMFRTSQADHIPSSGDEISPHNTHDGLQPFPLHGRNPLEQLGLFMKRDEEEEEDISLFRKRDEEEVVPSSVAGNGDVEEGEID